MSAAITRRPITPSMVERGAEKLWDDVRDEEGKISWKDAPVYARWPYERRAKLVLEAAIPQNAQSLRALSYECLNVAEIVE